MDAPSPDDPEANRLVKLTSLIILGAGLLALFSGHDWFWMVFALGFAVLVPLVKLVTDESGNPAGDVQTVRGESEPPVSGPKRDALDALRDRYARGELSETQFERKVETLLETETLEGARDHVGRTSERDSAAKVEREANADTGRAPDRR